MWLNQNWDGLMKALGCSLLLGLVLLPYASRAQVYSANAVGYHTLEVPSGGFCTVGALLNGTPNNHVNNAIKLPDPGSDGCLLFRWDSSLQTFKNPVTWYDGFGWYIDEDGDGKADPAIINPGEGAFIYVPSNSTNAQLRIELVGDLPQGLVCQPISGSGRLSFWTPLFCQRLNSIMPHAGDLLFIWDCALQKFKDNPIQFFDGYGWYSDEYPTSPEGPDIRPGEAVFIQSFGPSRIACNSCFICWQSDFAGGVFVESFRLRNPARNGNQFSFEFQTEPNVTYDVQAAVTSPCDATWNSLGSVTGNGEVRTFTDTNAVVLTKFYRVVVAQ
jgi:hypothetical protein